MPKKNLIAIIVMVVSLIAASLTLVFTVGLRVSADEGDEEEIVTVEEQYLNKSGTGLYGLTAEGRTIYESGIKNITLIFQKVLLISV